jgi:hypothetical protein
VDRVGRNTWRRGVDHPHDSQRRMTCPHQPNRRECARSARKVDQAHREHIVRKLAQRANGVNRHRRAVPETPQPVGHARSRVTRRLYVEHSCRRRHLSPGAHEQPLYQRRRDATRRAHSITRRRANPLMCRQFDTDCHRAPRAGLARVEPHPARARVQNCQSARRNYDGRSADRIRSASPGCSSLCASTGAGWRRA